MQTVCLFFSVNNRDGTGVRKEDSLTSLEELIPACFRYVVDVRMTVES
jgi:hypothetical protein